jgi:hypothetical protein
MANKLYRATAPDGTRIEFMAPEGLSEEAKQKLAYLEYQAKKTGKLPGREIDAKPEPAEEPASEALPSKVDELKGMAKQELEAMSPGVAGAGAGLLAGALESRKMGPASILEKGAQGAAQGVARTAPAAARPAAPPVAPPVAAPSILGPSGAPVNQPGGGAPLRPPAGGSAVQNYGKAFGLTDIETQRATDMTKQAGGVHDLTTQRREAMNLLSERFPSDRFIENPRYGGLMTPEPSVGGGPRAQYVQPQGGPVRSLPPTQPIPTTPKPAGALEEVTQLFRKMAEIGTKASSAIGGVARALPVLSYPLAGYSMGTDVGAIQEELAKERPDYADIALRGIGALGTGLSLHPVTAPVGIPMATIPPLIAAGRRKMREQPEMPEATYQEMVEASRPSFRMSRP